MHCILTNLIMLNNYFQVLTVLNCWCTISTKVQMTPFPPILQIFPYCFQIEFKQVPKFSFLVSLLLIPAHVNHFTKIYNYAFARCQHKTKFFHPNLPFDTLNLQVKNKMSAFTEAQLILVKASTKAKCQQ